MNKAIKLITYINLDNAQEMITFDSVIHYFYLYHMSFADFYSIFSEFMKDFFNDRMFLMIYENLRHVKDYFFESNLIYLHSFVQIMQK